MVAALKASSAHALVSRGPSNVAKVHEKLRNYSAADSDDADESDGGDEIKPAPTSRKREKDKPASKRSPIAEEVTAVNVERDKPAIYSEIQAFIAASFKNDAIPKRTGKSAPSIYTSSGSSVSKRRTRRADRKVRKKRARKQKKAGAAQRDKDVDSLICLDISESGEGSSLIGNIARNYSSDEDSERRTEVSEESI